MWGLITVVVLFILAEIVLISRYGIIGLIFPYVVGTGIWIFFPGYDTGYGTWMAVNLVVVCLSALGQILPGGPVGIAGAGIGGFLAGRWISRL